MVPSVCFQRRRQSGIAIILVLSILVLLTAVVIAFFTNATTDLTASKGYAGETQVKLLANAAVNVVEGQIRAATAGSDPDANPSSPVAWASQPGVIRTYDNGGKPVAAFKLYSSDELQVRQNDADSEFPFNPLGTQTQALDTPTNWNTMPSDFTDLNSPSVAPDPDGSLTDANNVKYSARFPIVDGNNLGTAPNVLGMTYVDPNNGNAQTISGFSVQTPATFNSGAAAPVIAPNNNPVPMPVRWLYVLQNGELHARVPQGATGATGGAPGTIPDASAANPVVGRIAFWTDDDTCKLNINTASEATAWDAPRAKTATDVKNANYIPGQNEYQMFPGHPAKTCLSTVFGSKWPIPLAGIINSTGDYQQLLPYYDLVPRVTSGLFNSATNSQGSAGAIQVASANGIIYDADRLYASIDELMFDAHTPTGGPPAMRPTRNVASNIPGGVAATGAIDPAFLETTRFFLTASNRAPEVTLFNTPRISLWPIQVQTSARTAKDALLAFCTTIPTSSMHTANPDIYYFQRLTVGENNSNTSCLSPTLDYTGAVSVQRNQSLYTYLQNLTSQPVPGLGGTFSAKYATGAYQQLLTEIFDQIRSGVNTTGSTTNGLNSGYSYTVYNVGYGTVVPLQPPLGTPGAGTQGFGRFPTITEAALDLFVINPTAAAATKSSIQLGAVLMLQPFTVSPGYPNFSPEYVVEVSGQGGFMIEQNAANDPPRSLGFNSNDDSNIVTQAVGGETTGSSTEYNTLLSMFTYNGNAKQLVYGAGNYPSLYPFFNTPAPPVTAASPPGTALGVGNLPNGTQFFDLNPNGPVQLTVKIYPYQNNPPQKGPQPVQTLVLNFPPAFKLPVPPTTTAYGSNTVSGSTASIFQNRILASDGNNSDQVDTYFGGRGSALIGPYDVVRSVIVDPAGPSKGDLRVIAALNSVPANYFTTHPYYDIYNPNPAVPPKTPPLIDPDPPQDQTYNWHFAESLRTGENPGYGEPGYNAYAGNAQSYLTTSAANSHLPLRRPAYAGSLVCGLPTTGVPLYGPEAAPAVPVGTNGAFLADGVTPGDWDSGLGIVEDGPYIDKPDEGNDQGSNTSGYAVSRQDQSPYFNRGYAAGGETGSTFSPNREVSSAVLFGSLPTGIDYTGATPVQPWQTLLFCAYPPAFATTGDPRKHPGFGTTVNSSTVTTLGLPVPPYKMAPDHVLLDFFTMPIVEPYAISEPLSTQGKVNMNYQIAPFTYIHRDTAVQAVLKGTKMMAIASSPAALASYKTDANAANTQYRYSIDPDETLGTLAAFEERFKGAGQAPADIFRSASEICTVPLVPKLDGGQTYDTTVPAASYSATAMQAFWNSCKLTGDNLREAPYGDLYARLTTKSNTFTVHVRVQTVKKSLGTSAATFIDPTDPTPGLKDVVTGEYRGSYQVERYVDPNVATTGANAFPDYVTAGLNATPISTFYKFHTIGAKQF